METFDWSWVEAQAERTAAAWRQSAAVSTKWTGEYTAEQQVSCESSYDEALRTVEYELQRAPDPSGAPERKQRIVECFGRFSARALELDGESINVLTEEFLPVGTGLAQWARHFDAALSMPSINQAARNAWTACGLQPLLGTRIQLTPSILGYSLLYPYSDNYLDDEAITAEDKLRFSRRFRSRLKGVAPPAEDFREHAMGTLVSMIERQYPREQYPQVFECLLAIHRAQEESIGQVSEPHAGHDGNCLQVSCAKGGSSVLTDACLAHGFLNEAESRFAFEWGVLLQLGDDLQDVREDLRRGSFTLFSRAAASREELDGLTIQLLNFSERVWERMAQLPHGTPSYRELMKMSWRSLILRAVAESHDFFSAGFLKEAERHSPFRFEFLRARNEKLASRQGLYASLFGALLEAQQPATSALTNHEQTRQLTF
ncbi:MAG: hypothetical protein JO270_16335 [Acidobacteriaceae bacterium]|nr:hypothetical protein [Acidobacteriaceae bacterium]